MKIGVIGVNHHQTPIEIREKFSFTSSQIIENSTFLVEQGLEEVVVLSTCNRCEIYFASEKLDESAREVIQVLEKHAALENARDYLFYKKQEDCVEHLFLVAGGLDSVVTGEDQILGQVSDALQLAMELKFSKKFLNRLFMNATHVGKKIRKEFKISEKPLSTSYIGIKMLREKVGSFSGKTALILGTGEIGQLSLRYLYGEDFDKIFITSRSCKKTDDLFEEFPDTELIPFNERYDYLSQVDILITATSAPHTLIKAELFPDLDHKLFILDLALPRDIDPEVGDLAFVNLIGLDDLKEISEENKEKREALSKQALDLVKKDTKKYMDWLGATKVDPIIASLKDKVQDIQEDSMAYITRKIDFTPRNKKLVDKMIHYALHRLIRETILTLKNTDDISKEEAEIVEELFDLHED